MTHFSVFQFFPDETYECVGVHMDAENAVKQAHSYTTRPAAMIGVIRRVIITDADDYCCFEWKYGEGVTFPKREDTEGSA